MIENLAFYPGHDGGYIPFGGVENWRVDEGIVSVHEEGTASDYDEVMGLNFQDG
jgi:hypothetical protein